MVEEKHELSKAEAAELPSSGLYETIQKLAGKDTLEIFGNSGSGKTTFCLEVVKAYIAKGKKVLYIDTEKNLLKVPQGITYKYFADFNDVSAFVQNLPQGYDLVVLDSMGLPILGKFAWLNARERGDILLKCEGTSSNLKIYCQKNNATSIVTNQPESEFGKNMYHILRPFGDKSIYFFKEVWKTKIIKQEPTITICRIEAFRSRQFGRKTELFELQVTKSGVKLESKVM